MTKEQAHNTAKSLLSFIKDYSQEEQLRIVAHVAAITTHTLTEEQAEEWLQLVGSIRWDLK